MTAATVAVKAKVPVKAKSAKRVVIVIPSAAASSVGEPVERIMP